MDAAGARTDAEGERSPVRCDLLVIGGGINGAGIARDAAGRGLSVLLVEKDDLAAHTSSSSSKLIHGGLRYLEQYEFRLVGESLAEREVLLQNAGHLVWPARFVMPHVPGLRPRWMIRIGLFLYDRLGRMSGTSGGSGASGGSAAGARLPGSHYVSLAQAPYNSGLKRSLRHGFAYSDCRVDDARLVVANVIDARERGAVVRTRTALLSARRLEGEWRARLADGGEVCARAIVNAAGPWVKEVLNEQIAQPSADNVRLVKGSHIVVPRVYTGAHAFILQNDDKRVVFMIPYEEKYTLIGTTDIAMQGALDAPRASDEEIAYLCRAANRYVANAIAPTDVVWHYAGVRPLYDDGGSDPSAVTRDYTLRVDDSEGRAPVLSVFGGKITTYRRLAEHALQKLAPYFAGLKPAWTAGSPLPGSGFAAGREAARAELNARYPKVSAGLLQALFRRHGTRAAMVLGDAQSDADLGEHFGANLHERELAYCVEHEWALAAEDVLWRRTKAGLHLLSAERERVERWFAVRA